MRRMPGLVMAIGLGTAGALAAQEPPSPQGDDIIVRGTLPMIRGGAWQLERSASTGGRRGSRPFTSRTCVADDDRGAVLRQLLALTPLVTQEQLCERMRLHGKGRELSATQHCTVVIPPRTIDGDFVHGTRMTRIRARLDPDRNVANYRAKSSLDGGWDSRRTWTLTARRLGPCSGRAPVAAMPDAARNDVPPAPDEPALEPGEMVIAATPPVAARVATAATGTTSDDILVVGRKLRQVRLHYATDGRVFRWCHADLSTGDPRLDRIGCAIVRACVREGFDDRVAALACFYRKVDEIDPPPAS